MSQSEFWFCRLTFKMSSPCVSQRADDMLNSGNFFSAFQDRVHRESNDCRNALIINLIMNRIENAWNINHYNTMKGCWVNQSIRNARQVRTTRPPIDNNNNMNSSVICLNIESAHNYKCNDFVPCSVYYKNPFWLNSIMMIVGLQKKSVQCCYIRELLLYPDTIFIDTQERRIDLEERRMDYWNIYTRTYWITTECLRGHIPAADTHIIIIIITHVIHVGRANRHVFGEDIQFPMLDNILTYTLTVTIYDWRVT